MRTVTAIEVLTANLPFRFSFGHALAERSETTNVYVRLTLDDHRRDAGGGDVRTDRPVRARACRPGARLAGGRVACGRRGDR